ncbi:Fork head domain family protein [Aspergillus niger]|uniref:Fork head domain family protein n=1 Tax=Aspergillus niger TaxID=5061 RepID=A0A505IDS7_ASPNG|nr:Fork head domain family protein [Aspergillus niger]
MFDMYLDIQKGIIMDDLAEDEVKGRWKSFMRKWNRGELAEGWYDPATLEKARTNLAQMQAQTKLAAEDAIAARQDSRAQYRSELRSHKSEIKYLQEEVAPRAEPGTHERRMEKRQEAAASNRAFAEAKQ